MAGFEHQSFHADDIADVIGQKPFVFFGRNHILSNISLNASVSVLNVHK